MEILNKATVFKRTQYFYRKKKKTKDSIKFRFKVLEPWIQCANVIAIGTSYVFFIYSCFEDYKSFEVPLQPHSCCSMMVYVGEKRHKLNMFYEILTQLRLKIFIIYRRIADFVTSHSLFICCHISFIYTFCLVFNGICRGTTGLV